MRRYVKNFWKNKLNRLLQKNSYKSKIVFKSILSSNLLQNLKSNKEYVKPFNLLNKNKKINKICLISSKFKSTNKKLKISRIVINRFLIKNSLTYYKNK